MDLGLAEKVALITGGSKGLGRASALALAREGCDLAILARTSADLARVSAEVQALGVRCLALPADATRASDAERAVDETIDRYGRVDILVNCAGGAAAGGLFELDDAEWRKAYELKVIAYLNFTRAVVPLMRRNGDGRIIMMSGTAGKQPAPYSLCIGALNAAINNLTRGLAEYLARDGIGVLAVSPGPVGTERWGGLQEGMARVKGVTVEEARETILESIPLGRIARPEEVGNLVAYLASPLAAYLTGVNVVLDGGAVKVI